MKKIELEISIKDFENKPFQFYFELRENQFEPVARHCKENAGNLILDRLWGDAKFSLKNQISDELSKLDIPFSDVVNIKASGSFLKMLSNFNYAETEELQFFVCPRDSARQLMPIKVNYDTYVGIIKYCRVKDSTEIDMDELTARPEVGYSFKKSFVTQLKRHSMDYNNISSIKLKDFDGLFDTESLKFEVDSKSYAFLPLSVDTFFQKEYCDILIHYCSSIDSCIIDINELKDFDQDTADHLKNHIVPFLNSMEVESSNLSNVTITLLLSKEKFQDYLVDTNKQIKLPNLHTLFFDISLSDDTTIKNFPIELDDTDFEEFNDYRSFFNYAPFHYILLQSFNIHLYNTIDGTIYKYLRDLKKNIDYTGVSFVGPEEEKSDLTLLGLDEQKRTMALPQVVNKDNNTIEFFSVTIPLGKVESVYKYKKLLEYEYYVTMNSGQTYNITEPQYLFLLSELSQ